MFLVNYGCADSTFLDTINNFLEFVKIIIINHNFRKKNLKL